MRRRLAYLFCSVWLHQPGFHDEYPVCQRCGRRWNWTGPDSGRWT